MCSDCEARDHGSRIGNHGLRRSDFIHAQLAVGAAILTGENMRACA